MSSDPTEDRSENRVPHAGVEDAPAFDDVEKDERASATRSSSRRRTSKPRRPPRPSRGKNEEVRADRGAFDDSNERLRENAAEILAATRERIVEHPLQAVLVAAAAGAFAALLLGAARR